MAAPVGAPKGHALPRVKMLRERHWLTQQELADAAGLKVVTVRRIERGGTAKVRTVKALALALEVTPEELCEVAAEQVSA